MPPAEVTVAAAVGNAHRREWAFVLAATVRVTRDLDLTAVHDEAPSAEDTDWEEVVGVEAVAPLADEPRLAGYPYLAVARAEFLHRLGRTDDARLAYEEALLLTENGVERAHLAGRLARGGVVSRAEAG